MFRVTRRRQAAPGDAAGASRQLLSEFPEDLLLDGNTVNYEDSTNKYWLAFHALGVIYMFVGLAVGASRAACADPQPIAALRAPCCRLQLTLRGTPLYPDRAWNSVR